MSSNFTESDWKAFRRYEKAMLESLMTRLNRKAESILAAPEKTAKEKYHALYDHVQSADQTVAACFDDWRRSQLGIRALSLFREKLIPDALWDELSESARETLTSLRDL